MESLLEKFDESSGQLHRLYEWAESIGDTDKECKIKVDALRALHSCFTSHTAKMSHEMDSIKSAEEQEAEEIESEVAALEKELQMFEEISSACNADDHPFPSMDIHSIEAYRLFATQLADFTAQLSVLQGALQDILSQSPLQVVEVPSLLARCGMTNKAVWDARRHQIQTSWESLRGCARRAGVLMSEGSLIKAQNLLNEVILLGKRAVNHVTDALTARAERESEMKKVEVQKCSLVAWCHQQQANLDVLNDPGHLQEFCASLLEHYKTMSENYRVLLEAAEPFLNNKAIQECLIEANEVWISLHVKTLERLQCNIIEVQKETLLEGRLKELISSCLQVGHFLKELENSLEATCDSVSSLKQRCLQLLEECGKLWQEIPQHEELFKGLLLFAERMQMEREAYSCYRAAALSRAACLTSTSDVLADVGRRKEEYKSCEEELRVWAEQKARGDTWRDIRDKVMNIKILLEEELQSIEVNATAP